MNGIKYYALDENEEVPYEFVVIRNVNGEPEFCASFVNTNSLAYENGVLLKLHQRNDELRAENAKLRKELESVGTAAYLYGRGDLKAENAKLRELVADVHESLKADTAGMFHNLTLSAMEDDMRELGIEVDYGQQRDV